MECGGVTSLDIVRRHVMLPNLDLHLRTYKFIKHLIYDTEMKLILNFVKSKGLGYQSTSRRCQTSRFPSAECGRSYEMERRISNLLVQLK